MTRKYRKEHRRVWEKHFGKIPKDENGRSYEIHHLDNNPLNNDINNLVCLSIDDHYTLHKSKGEYGAAFLIAKRMKIKPNDIAEVARKITLDRVMRGIHNFQDPNFPRSMDHNIGFVVAKKLDTEEIVRVTKEQFEADKNLVGSNAGRKQKKVHTNRGGNKGKHWQHKNKEVPKKCTHCDIVGRGSLLSRWHNDNCKHNKVK